MADAEMLRRYIADFNSGNAEGYSACYADDVVLSNGGGRVLHGRDAIVSFYADVRKRLERLIEIDAIVAGNAAITAVLSSDFLALEDGVELGGAILAKGDRMLLRSVALYELAHGKFQSIHAVTLNRRLVRRGDQP